MSRELSEQARTMLARALAEERPRVPGPTRRAQLKRSLLAGAALAAAGRAAAAPMAQVAFAPGTAGAASVLTFAKGLVVGLLISGGVVGATQYFSGVSMPAPPGVASAPPSAARSPRSAPVATVAAADPSAQRSFAETSASSATTPPRAPSEASPAEPALRLSAELELMTAAQAALRDGRAAQALSLIERYDRTFPTGQLRGERLAAEVFAACLAGDRPRATRAAQRFSQRDVSSVLAGRVRRSCAFEGVEGQP